MKIFLFHQIISVGQWPNFQLTAVLHNFARHQVLSKLLRLTQNLSIKSLQFWLFSNLISVLNHQRNEYVDCSCQIVNEFQFNGFRQDSKQSPLLYVKYCCRRRITNLQFVCNGVLASVTLLSAWIGCSCSSTLGPRPLSSVLGPRTPVRQPSALKILQEQIYE